MTGAGSASVAFVKETEFGTLPGTPTYYLPGRNVTVETLELQNTLERLDVPDEAESVDSLIGNLEGALSASWAMSADTHADVRDIVFDDAGSSFTGPHAPTSAWYLGVEYLESTSATATAERALSGVIPLEYQLQYQQETNTVQASLTMAYADEETNTTLTPGTVEGPTDGSEVPFHGVSLDIDGVTVEKLQSATLSISNIARYQHGPSRTPLDAVLDNPETTLSAAAIFGDTQRLELAYGSSGATSTQDRLTNVAGTLTFDSQGATVATFSLPKLKPDSYSWDGLVESDADLTEPTDMHVNGGVSVS